ncbi:MAG: DNA starvation/stationary phase protection protein [Chitinophagales bacterium]|nr:DNA starvation/stationary phase protection protein [Chitinophagales bacterium]MDW8393483.1 DNA starvation/stationary phase protection protein [Chitinophagales bacterium]
MDKSKARKLAAELNGLLADYMVFYQNVRGLHWNIKGKKFFELHAQFETLYNYLITKADEVAERVLTLQEVPLHTFEDYLSASSIKSRKNLTGGEEAVRAVLEDLLALLQRQRELLLLANETGDEGTAAILSEYVKEQEKMAWMYEAFLND